VFRTQLPAKVRNNQEQGDQTGRIFTNGVIAYFGQFLKMMKDQIFAQLFATE
jgi:hypothetical protein